MRNEYESNFGQMDDAEHLKDESDADLKLHWRAVEATLFYAAADDLANAALRVFVELENRNLADNKSATSVFNALLSARHFAAASAFAAKHASAELPILPEFIDAKIEQPSAWRFTPDVSTVERINIDLQAVQILVVAVCHFSADAAKDISGDPVLGPVFAKHARWLSLQPGSERLDALAEWNREHSGTPMLAIYDRREWAFIEQWTMPTFTIIKDGKVIDSTKGWDSRDPEFRMRLVDLLARNGMLDAGVR